MREPERQTFYLVGTPKGRINQQEKKWLDLPWQKVLDSVEVKLYQHEGELYALAKSERLRSNLTGENPAVLWTRYVRSGLPCSMAVALCCRDTPSRIKTFRPC